MAVLLNQKNFEPAVPHVFSPKGTDVFATGGLLALSTDGELYCQREVVL